MDPRESVNDSTFEKGFRISYALTKSSEWKEVGTCGPYHTYDRICDEDACGYCEARFAIIWGFGVRTADCLFQFSAHNTTYEMGPEYDEETHLPAVGDVAKYSMIHVSGYLSDEMLEKFLAVIEDFREADRFLRMEEVPVMEEDPVMERGTLAEESVEFWKARKW